MCQMNLDAYQRETNRHFHTSYQIPVLFFTQLMGVAFGKDPQTLGFGRELVNAGEAMSRIGVEAPKQEPPEKPAQPRRKKPTGLPMPVMKDQYGEPVEDRHGAPVPAMPDAAPVEHTTEE